LGAPVTLPANTEYYLASREEVGGDYFYSYNTTVTTTAAASVLSAAYNSSGTWTLIGGVGNSYGPVGLKYCLGVSGMAVAQSEGEWVEAALGGVVAVGTEAEMNDGPRVAGYGVGAEPLVLRVVDSEQGGLVLQWATQEGMVYRVYGSVEWGAGWELVHETIGDGAVQSFDVTSPWTLYRVAVGENGEE